MPTLEEKGKREEYLKDAEKEDGVVFAGRLGTGEYMNMNVAIRRALDLAKELT